jgi:O-antigen/teichoic acid export membrane protein
VRLTGAQDIYLRNIKFRYKTYRVFYSKTWQKFSSYEKIDDWENFVSVLSILKQSSFLKYNAIFFMGALLVSLLNYLYYPVVGRLLNLSQFGEVQVLVSLFTQLTLFITVIGQVVVNIVANQNGEARDKLLAELYRFALGISGLLFIVGVLGSWWFKDIFRFDSIWPFIILLISLVITVPVTFVTSFLRGKKKFGAVSGSNIVGAAGKLVGSAALVLLSFGTAGAIGGLVVAQLLALLYVWKYVKQLHFIDFTFNSYVKRFNFKLLRPELAFSGFVLVASLGVAVLSSIDVLVVKAFFEPEVAGGYAGISTVAKIIFFLTASVAQVMLPSIKSNLPKVENRRYLLKSSLLVTLLGGVVLGIFALFPNFVVTIFMGPNFANYANLLPILSVASFVLSVINLIVFYYIALRTYSIALIIVAGLLLTGTLLLLGHNSLQAVAFNVTFGCIAMFVMFVIWRLGRVFIKRKPDA